MLTNILTMNNPPLHSHTHCQVAQKTNRTNQNLSKSVSVPSLGRKINNEGTTPKHIKIP